MFKLNFEFFYFNLKNIKKALFDIDGRIWAIDEVPVDNIYLQQDGNASAANISKTKLSSQLFDSQRRFVMITPQVFL